MTGDRDVPPAHGSKEMPVWGPIFKVSSQRHVKPRSHREHRRFHRVDPGEIGYRRFAGTVGRDVAGFRNIGREQAVSRWYRDCVSRL